MRTDKEVEKLINSKQKNIEKVLNLKIRNGQTREAIKKFGKWLIQ